MFDEKVRAILGARALLDENDPRIEQKWMELTDALSENEDLTLNFLKNCTKTELSYLSEVFEDVAYNLQSKKYIESHPMIANIAKILGDLEEGIKISDFCSKEASDFLFKEVYFGKVFEYYIQLARYVDNNPTYSKHLSVYEPLIRIAERGGFFVLKAHELDIIDVSYIPLDNWYARFVEIEPIDINNL
ncbi:hypothetical protein LOY85_06145 [Brevibacillus brevis]|uniref:hypothetical protein n=1 Tax=Brevibacillus brevis TaxID=1393 RepID=UPI001F47C285|nr:hypothetical protein [Brevibacillus brevis]UIO43731.1 hypothetical protein LOY85_06145 [Brevibacillus brevis]